jgi:hypothetical protein
MFFRPNDSIESTIKLRFFFSNTRSIRNKIELLNAKLIELDIDTVMLNETWLQIRIIESNFEEIWVEIVLNKEKLLLGTLFASK